MCDVKVNFLYLQIVPHICVFVFTDQPRIQENHHHQPGEHIPGKTGPVHPKSDVLGVLKRRGCKNENSAHKEHAARGMN